MLCNSIQYQETNIDNIYIYIHVLVNIHTTLYNNTKCCKTTTVNTSWNVKQWNMLGVYPVSQTGSIAAGTGHGLKDAVLCGLNPSESMGWLKGKSTGNHRFSREIWDCPVFFPLNQPIDWNIWISWDYHSQLNGQIQGGAPVSDSFQLVNITSICLWFMALITNWLLGFINQFINGGPHIVEHVPNHQPDRIGTKQPLTNRLLQAMLQQARLKMTMFVAQTSKRNEHLLEYI